MNTLGRIADSVHLLDGGAQTYPRMLQAIAQSQMSVHLEAYSFSPLGVGEQFILALSQASIRGVLVEVVLDGWGSARGAGAVASALRSSGCSVRIRRWILSMFLGRFARNHRKLLLVDDTIAFIGGINIGNENLDEGLRPGWADLALEITGTHSARLGEMIRNEPRHVVDGALRIHLARLGGGWRLRRRYLQAFAEATQTIHLAHGYFLPDRRVVRAITSAAQRGVQVRLLLAGRSDVPFARAATRSLYRQLLAAGVAIHEWSDSVLHAKVATVDGQCLLVGSYNLDPFSLANLEVLVEVADTTVVSQGEAWIQDHFARSDAVLNLTSGSMLEKWVHDPIGRMVAKWADSTSRMLVARRRRKHLTSTSATAPRLAWARKVVVAAIGSSVLLFGIALIVLPGPAVLVVPLGLAILATEFHWAHHLLQRLRAAARLKGTK